MVSYWSRVSVGLAVLCSALAFHASDTAQRRGVITRDPHELAEARKTLRGMPRDRKIAQPNGSQPTVAELLQRLDQFEKSAPGAAANAMAAPHAAAGQLEPSMLESVSSTLNPHIDVGSKPHPTLFWNWYPVCFSTTPCVTDAEQTVTYKLKPGFVFTSATLDSNNDTRLETVSPYGRGDLTLKLNVAWWTVETKDATLPWFSVWVYVKPVPPRLGTGPATVKPPGK